MKLWASSSDVDTDFTAKLLDVYPANKDFPGGFDLNIAKGIRMALLTPVERPGVGRKVGSLAKVKPANLLVVDPEFVVRGVFICGEEIWRGERLAARVPAA